MAAKLTETERARRVAEVHGRLRRMGFREREITVWLTKARGPAGQTPLQMVSNGLYGDLKERLSYLERQKVKHRRLPWMGMPVR